MLLFCALCVVVGGGGIGIGVGVGVVCVCVCVCLCMLSSSVRHSCCSATSARIGTLLLCNLLSRLTLLRSGQSCFCAAVGTKQLPVIGQRFLSLPGVSSFERG